MPKRKRDIAKELVSAMNWAAAYAQGKKPRGGRVHTLSPDVKNIRDKLGVTQREFASRFHLNARTVQEWEQGRAAPDQPARVLLTVIEQSPDLVERALKKALKSAA